MFESIYIIYKIDKGEFFMQTNTANAIGKKSKTQLVSWILIAALAILLITLAILGVTKNGGVGILIVCIFAIVHGINRYGAKNMIIFFIIASVISWCFESLSIVMGFPFGHYYYLVDNYRYFRK